MSAAGLTEAERESLLRFGFVVGSELVLPDGTVRTEVAGRARTVVLRVERPEGRPLIVGFARANRPALRLPAGSLGDALAERVEGTGLEVVVSNAEYERLLAVTWRVDLDALAAAIEGSEARSAPDSIEWIVEGRARRTLLLATRGESEPSEFEFAALLGWLTELAEGLPVDWLLRRLAPTPKGREAP